jgi:hypothetical protein
MIMLSQEKAGHGHHSAAAQGLSVLGSDARVSGRDPLRTSSRGSARHEYPVPFKQNMTA